jgi:hypothetical protein
LVDTFTMGVCSVETVGAGNSSDLVRVSFYSEKTCCYEDGDRRRKRKLVDCQIWPIEALAQN